MMRDPERVLRIIGAVVPGFIVAFVAGNAVKAADVPAWAIGLTCFGSYMATAMLVTWCLPPRQNRSKGRDDA